jgi:hypothetical protein
MTERRIGLFWIALVALGLGGMLSLAAMLMGWL